MNESGQPTVSSPVGQYYLLEKIAQGGMAEIYKGMAYDLHGIKRTVVIKKILPHVASNREFIDMLVAEAKIAVMLNHGNIAQIYDLGKVAEDYFIVMEYVEGKSISQIQRALVTEKKIMPIDLACYITAEIAAGLHYMHDRIDERGEPLHIVHRDVSPQNVLISQSGTVKIIDFGIAKARTKLDITEVGVLKGKFAYMSPEHASGESIDHRSDIFSLGIILYEMLTGKRLFKAKDNKQTLRNVRQSDVQPASTLRKEIPEELDKILLKSLAKYRGERYQTAAALRSDLLQFLHRTYADFRSQKLEGFLSELFVEEIAVNESGELEKTPVLIIDHTQSAIADDHVMSIHNQAASGKKLIEKSIPAIMQEFMLPEDDIHEESKAVHGVTEELSQDESELNIEEPSTTTSIWSPHIILRKILDVGLKYKYLFVALLLLPLFIKIIFPSQVPKQKLSSPLVQKTLTEMAHAIISTNPPGASIYVNDVNTGVITPAQLNDLKSKETVEIGLHLEGYKFWKMKITPQPDRPSEISVALQPEYGRLKIESRPTGAEVWINNERFGQTPMMREEIKPGSILSIEVRKEGFVSKNEQVRIGAGSETSKHFILDKIK